MRARSGPIGLALLLAPFAASSAWAQVGSDRPSEQDLFGGGAAGAGALPPPNRSCSLGRSLPTCAQAEDAAKGASSNANPIGPDRALITYSCSRARPS